MSARERQLCFVSWSTTRTPALARLMMLARERQSPDWRRWFEMVAAARPGDHAIHRHVGVVANDGQAGRFVGAIGAEIAQRFGTLGGSGHQFAIAGPQFGVLVGLFENGAPQLVFASEHGGRRQTRILAVRPAPPVEETNLMRRNFACTAATVRASPATLVVASIC
jgi:hypothetical protein